MSFVYLTTPYRFRHAPSYPGLWADSMGFVWIEGISGLRPACVCISSKGYPRSSIRGKEFKVHAVVLDAFYGRRPSPKHVSRHLNDIKTDNRPENLAWGSMSDNILDYRMNFGVWPSQGKGERRFAGKRAQMKPRTSRDVLKSLIIKLDAALSEARQLLLDDSIEH